MNLPELAEWESWVSESIEVTVAVVVTPDMVDRAERTEPESTAWDCEISVIDVLLDVTEFAVEIRETKREVVRLFLLKNKRP